MSADATPETLDGVPVFHGPHPEGDYAAGLVFRVGRADETLATSGITHLVEHLALHGHGMSDLHYNGTTADLYTHFFVHGTREHVVEYLHGVCAGLRDLPLHRLETEKQILRTESGRRTSSQGLIYRYGARGHGLPAYGELGLGRIGPQQLTDWVARHFTRGNAALWISGEEVPAELALDLPDGPRVPVPDLGHELPQTPAWFPADENAVLADGLLPRSAEAQVYTQVLAKALFRDLRQRDGISYRAEADYQPRDRETVTVWAYADCPPEQRGALVGSFVDCVARLRLAGPTEAELAAAKATVDEPLDDDDASAGLVPGRAFGHLVDRPVESIEQLRAEIAAVTADDVRRTAQQWHESCLVQAPVRDLEWAAYARAPEFTPDQVRGQKLAPAGPTGVELVLGDDAIGRHIEGEDWVTIRFADVAALQRWPDGGLALIGRDGLRLAIEPTLTMLSDDVVRRVFDAVPDDRVVNMPPRDPQSVPHAHQPRPPQSGPQPLHPVLKWLSVLSGVVCALFALLFGLAAVTSLPEEVPAAVLLAVMAAVLGYGGYWLIRRALR